MAKVNAQEIIDLGFSPEMLKEADEGELSALIDEIISEQAPILEGRIGSTNYASAISPTKEYVKRAEKCLVAAELIQRRINIILGNVIGAGQPIDILHEGTQKKIYKEEADSLIEKIIAGGTSDSSDFASGVLTTSHFETET